jgi:hypothetical protein
MQIYLTIILFSLINGLVSFPGINSVTIQESNECLKKSSSEWGSNCGACYNSSKSYRVNLKNVCTENIDVKVAVQEKTMRWRTFNQNNLAPGDSISAYACEGTGKYIFFTRKAGDKTIIFHTDDEVEKDYAPDKN